MPLLMFLENECDQLYKRLTKGFSKDYYNYQQGGGNPTGSDLISSGPGGPPDRSKLENWGLRGMKEGIKSYSNYQHRVRSPTGSDAIIR